MGASLNPDYYKQKISLAVAFAPIVKLDGSNNGMMAFAYKFEKTLTTLIQTFGFYDLISMSDSLK